MRSTCFFGLAVALATASSCQRESTCSDCLARLELTIAEASGSQFPQGSYRFATDGSADAGTLFEVAADSQITQQLNGSGSMTASPSGTSIVVSGLDPYHAARFAVFRRFQSDAGILSTQERLIGEADYRPDPGLGPEQLSCGPCPNQTMMMVVDSTTVDAGDE